MPPFFLLLFFCILLFSVLLCHALGVWLVLLCPCRKSSSVLVLVDSLSPPSPLPYARPLLGLRPLVLAENEGKESETGSRKKERKRKSGGGRKKGGSAGGMQHVYDDGFGVYILLETICIYYIVTCFIKKEGQQ